MTSRFLGTLHTLGLVRLVEAICRLGYFLKGYGNVNVKFHREFRAFSYKVKGVTYMSPGSGWAANFDFFDAELKKSFAFKYVAKPGDTVIDIGAGLGEESIVFVQRVGKEGKVVSIEANPTTFKGLMYMWDQNRFPWMKPLNVAVYSSNGKVLIEDNTENYLGNTINSNDKDAVEVEAQTLDYIVKSLNINQIDFLKCNIEGAEKYLIQGMDNSVNLIKNLCISCHDFRHNVNNESAFYVTKSEVVKFLKEHDFKVEMRNTGNALVDDYVYASKT